MLALRKFGLINAPVRVEIQFGSARETDPPEAVFSQADAQAALTDDRA
jgi:hypothetical protein